MKDSPVPESDNKRGVQSFQSGMEKARNDVKIPEVFIIGMYHLPLASFFSLWVELTTLKLCECVLYRSRSIAVRC